MLWDSNLHVHQVLSKSERVWCNPLGDLTGNDPFSDKQYFIFLRARHTVNEKD